MERLTPIFIFVLVIVSLFGGNSPEPVDEYIKSCKDHKSNYIKCWTSSLQGLRQYLRNGLPDYNIPPIDPISVPFILFNSSNWSGTLIKPVFTGLKNFNILTASINDDQSTITFNITFPIINLQSTYYAKGHFQEFKFDGDGRVNTVLGNTSMILNLHQNNYLNDGNVSGLMSDVKIGALQIGQEGLFDEDLNSDKAFTKAINNNDPQVTGLYNRLIFNVVGTTLSKYISLLYNMRIYLNTAS